MANIQDVLTGITMYPIPSRTLNGISARRGVTLSQEATQEVIGSAGFNLCKADILMWLSLAPNVTQGGQSYSFTDDQRQQFRNQANGLYREFSADDDSAAQKPIYGYKGNRL